jgi:hypothetical protein
MPRAPRPPRLQAELDRIARERLETERLANRQSRGALARACLECVGSCVLGLVIMAYGFHTTDVLVGKAFLLGGMAVGYTGMLIALVGAYRRGEERGDW